MDLNVGQLIIILAPYMDYEIYANVKQVTEEGIMLLLKSNSEVPVDKELLCLAIDNDNIFEFYTQVNARNGNVIFVKMPEVNEYTKVEKRKFNRVDCNIGFVGTPVSISNIPLTSLDKRFTGKIKNISGGGVLIETSLKLPVDMVFEFKLKLNFFLDCKAKIVRTVEGQNGLYESGCQFVDYSLENIKVISLYAFKERLRQKRIELNERKI